MQPHFLAALAPILILQTACGQGWSWRDTPFLAKTFTPVAGGPSCPTTSAGVYANLTHYWACEEAAGNSRADSKGAINLTESGGTVAQGTGICGNCISISSSHFLDSVSSVFPGIGSASSFSFWFKDPSGVSQMKMWSSCPGGADGSPTVDSGAQIVPGNCGNGGGINDYPYSANAWHLVVMVSTAPGDQSVSVDGSAVTLSDNNIFESFSGICQLGADYVSGTVLIDEVGVYNVALTDGNCATLWASGAGLFYRP